MRAAGPCTLASRRRLPSVPGAGAGDRAPAAERHRRQPPSSGASSTNCGGGSFPPPQMRARRLHREPARRRLLLRQGGRAQGSRRQDPRRRGAGPCRAAALPDEEIIERLTQVRGIGRWTVEMLLMFRLGRPDVLPVDDFGVRAGFRAAYGLRRCRTPKALAAWGERWGPTARGRLVPVAGLELKRAGTLPVPAERIRLPRVKKRRRRRPRRKRRSAPQGAACRRRAARAGRPSARSVPAAASCSPPWPAEQRPRLRRAAAS